MDELSKIPCADRVEVTRPAQKTEQSTPTQGGVKLSQASIQTTEPTPLTLMDNINRGLAHELKLTPERVSEGTRKGEDEKESGGATRTEEQRAKRLAIAAGNEKAPHPIPNQTRKKCMSMK